ncbi:MAG: aminotransferase class I/II-fold pyridoxal phosphate-dependent enzyme, partial [Oscillospiraceae bacterium]|nr:aminotransferase class I/II-fold pyridoxal phosphate-dependent enzyme [Oscillospiraceae bacterium]
MHGGDIYFTSEKLLDFSANINPFGVPESVITAIKNALSDIAYYPDSYQRKLRQELANYHQIQANQIVCGNGGADVLFRTIQAIQPKNALLPVPVFTEYEKALLENNSNINYWNMPDLQITEDLILELEQNNYDFLILCNPNNPTGNCIARELLLKILNLAKQKNIFILLDECFFDMTSFASEQNSMIQKILEFENLFILKSMTKLYALAGLRLGYGISANINLIEKIRTIGQPWAVNSLASVAGCVALQDNNYKLRFLDFLIQEREFLFQELKKLNFKVWKPNANYIFFEAENYPDLDKKLLNFK